MEYAALAAAAVSALGAYAGGNAQNEANQSMSQEARDWMERMSSTAYQRATADMQKAGLNPLIAYSQGGASTPTTQAPVMQNVLGEATKGASSSALQAMNVMQGAQAVKTNEAQAANFNAQTDKMRSETLTNDLNTAYKSAEIDQTRASTGNLKALAANTSEAILGTRYSSQAEQMKYRANMGHEELKGTGFEADTRRRKAEASLSELEIPGAKARAAFDTSTMGRLNPYLQQFLQILHGGSSAYSRSFK